MVAGTEKYRFHCLWRYIDGRPTHDVTFCKVMDNHFYKHLNNPVQSQRKCRCTESNDRKGLNETGNMLCGNTPDPIDNDREPTYTNIGIINCVGFAWKVLWTCLIDVDVEVSWFSSLIQGKLRIAVATSRHVLAFIISVTWLDTYTSNNFSDRSYVRWIANQNNVYNRSTKTTLPLRLDWHDAITRQEW